MATINRPDKITLDAYSDPNLKYANNGGSYSSFTNKLQTPILNVKGIQLLNVNMVNTPLQLNDQYSLMFFFYINAISWGNLRCVRLLPSNFVPFTGYTTFTKNKYFNTVEELVAQLNVAASTGGDDTIFNPAWAENTISFSYDATTRRISVISTGETIIYPAAADDPNVISLLTKTNEYSGGVRPVMNAYNCDGTYNGAIVQPYVVGQSMNARLGFAMSYYNRGVWWSQFSQQGCATSTGIGFAQGDGPIEADAYPILLGAQNMNVYLDIVSGSGLDSRTRKNLAGSVPIEVAPLNINSYTLTSVEQPLISCNTEIYEITVQFLDDNGQPFFQPQNFNTQVSFSLYYE